MITKLLVPRVPTDEFARELAKAGLPVVCAPVTEKRPTPFEDWKDPMERLREGEYVWVVISSVATTTFLTQHCSLEELFSQVNVAAVGSATADSLQHQGIHVDLVGPDPASAATLLSVFPQGSGSVLLPGAVGAAPTLGQGLIKLGYDVEKLCLYESIALENLPLEWAEALAPGVQTFVLITAGSVAQAAHRLMSKIGVKQWPIPIAFGKSSAKVLSDLGWPAAATCETTDTEGVVAAYNELNGRKTE